MATNVTLQEFMQLWSNVNTTKSGSGRQAALTFIYCLVSIVATLGNGLVIFVVVRRRSMKQCRNVFITNLAVVDFITAITLIPFIRIPQILDEWHYGTFLCKFINGFCGTKVYCSAMTVCMMSAERYFSVIRKTLGPLLSKQQIALSLLIIWSMSVLFCTPIIVFYNVKIEKIDLRLIENATQIRIVRPVGVDLVPASASCTFNPTFPYKILNTVLQTLFVLPLPLLVLCVFNYRLHKFLAEREKIRRAKFAKDCSQQSEGNAGPESVELLQHSRNSVKQKEPAQHSSCSLRNEANRSQHRRLTVMLTSMVTSYAIFWLPFTVFTILLDFVDVLQAKPDLTTLIDECTQLLAYCSLCVNPILYGYLNKNFNREFRILFSDVQQKLMCRKTETGLTVESREQVGLTPVQMKCHETAFCSSPAEQMNVVHV